MKIPLPTTRDRPVRNEPKSVPFRRAPDEHPTRSGPKATSGCNALRLEFQIPGASQRTISRISASQAGSCDRSLDPAARAQELTGRDYVSYSAISTYQRCPLQYFFRYVAGLDPEFVPASLVFGGAVHAAIEHHFRCMLEGGAQPGLDELLAVFDEAWEAERQHASIRFAKAESAEALRDLADRMLAAFLASDVSKPDGSGGQLLGVEEELRGEIASDCPELLGRIDLVALRGDTLRIVDFKTSRSRWSDAKIHESSPQMLLYAELARPLAEACEARNVRIEWIVLTKTKEPVVELHSVQPDAGQVARNVAIVRRVWEAIAAEHFYPSPSAMNCSTCPFQAACAAWEG